MMSYANSDHTVSCQQDDKGDHAMRIDAVSLALVLALAMAWVPLSTINALTDSAATAAGRGLVSKSSYRFSHQQDTNDYVAVFEPPLGMSKTEVRAAASALSHHAF